MTYGSETWTLTMGLIRRLRVTQRAIERAMLGVSLRDQIRNKEIRSRARVTDIAQLVAKLKWWGARCSENRWTLGFQGVGVVPRNGKRSVGDPQPGRKTTSNESRGATGYKRPTIVEFGTPNKRRMSSVGRQSVHLMMMKVLLK
ncbi:jg18032 [Pararge aegeria aegeria]|uniref:Jg18032 protein n=1 Tax=Pararge aegeria aegeria TaxID=348720 RepID=A0A8S4QX51_9NEOP|nr:jg18032 [Pararge aegeria aegeria]